WLEGLLRRETDAATRKVSAKRVGERAVTSRVISMRSAQLYTFPCERALLGCASSGPFILHSQSHGHSLPDSPISGRGRKRRLPNRSSCATTTLGRCQITRAQRADPT